MKTPAFSGHCYLYEDIVSSTEMDLQNKPNSRSSDYRPKCSYKNAQYCRESNVYPERAAVYHHLCGHVPYLISLLHMHSQIFKKETTMLLQFFARKRKKQEKNTQSPPTTSLPPTPTHSIYDHGTQPYRGSPPTKHQTTSSTKSPRSTPWYQGYS
jgi:hypothetical protein